MDVRGYIDQNAPGFFEALRQWLAIPSISADPARHADVRRSAEWLSERIWARPTAEAAAYLWGELATAPREPAAAP
jgi:hypothetical protein